LHIHSCHLAYAFDGYHDLPSYPTRRSSDLTKELEIVSYSRDANAFKVRYRRGKALAPDEKQLIQKGDKGKITTLRVRTTKDGTRSEEHTSELQSRENLVCRLLLEKKNESIG